jgi:hypothetical protein
MENIKVISFLRGFEDRKLGMPQAETIISLKKVFIAERNLVALSIHFFMAQQK